MSSLKELLELRHSEDYERDFKAFQEQVLPLMNQLAKENAELKLALEEKPLSDSEWPKDLKPPSSEFSSPDKRNGAGWEGMERLLCANGISTHDR